MGVTGRIGARVTAKGEIPLDALVTELAENRAEFPHDLVPELSQLGVAGVAYDGYGFRGRSALLEGFVGWKSHGSIPRWRHSWASRAGCPPDRNICGSEVQKQRWLPAMTRLEKIESFCLTEPEAIKNKMALRVVQNAMVTLENCRVPRENMLVHANSFADTAKVLKMISAGVAWIATGCAMGAFEHALAFSKRREQFGKPIGSFQLVQDQLLRMLAGITNSMTFCHRLSVLQDEGRHTDEQASLAKAYTTVSTPQTVGLARELLGGNGIVLDEQVGRYVADAEAIYSYEGTREINTLIVGRALTGKSAFV